MDTVPSEPVVTKWLPELPVWNAKLTNPGPCGKSNRNNIFYSHTDTHTYIPIHEPQWEVAGNRKKNNNNIKTVLYYIESCGWNHLFIRDCFINDHCLHTFPLDIFKMIKLMKRRLELFFLHNLKNCFHLGKIQNQFKTINIFVFCLMNESDYHE